MLQSWRRLAVRSISAAEIRGLDSVEVDAEKPAWRSMQPKIEAWIPWKWILQAGVEVEIFEDLKSRTSNFLGQQN
jgi:hypothetical protein